MVDSFLSAFFLLLIVLDPLGNMPPFIALTEGLAPARRRRVVLRECLIGTAILAVFALVGERLLRYTRISPGTLGLTGGVLLFIIAMKMVYKDREEHPAGMAGEEPFIVPMAAPLFAGPSAIALTALNAAPGNAGRWGWIAGMFAACMVATLVLVTAGSLAKKIGRKGVAAIERLMGLVLATVSVQMALDGFRDYWTTLPAR